jgi:hypothetical protein
LLLNDIFTADDDALIAQNEEEKGDNLTINENINENEKRYKIITKE